MTDRNENDIASSTLSSVESERAKSAAKAADGANPVDTTYTTSTAKAEAELMNRDPISGAAGAHPIGTGIGSAGGAAAGAIFGSVAGPVGSVVGGVIGAVVGGLVGRGAGEEANPTPDAIYWRDAYVREPYFNSTYVYEDYAPAYRFGYQILGRSGTEIWKEQQDEVLRQEWEQSRGDSRLTWEDARSATRAAWERHRSRT